MKLEPALTFVGMRGVSHFWPGGAPFCVLCAGNIGVLFFISNQPNIPWQAIVLELGIIYLQFAPVAQLG